MSDPITPEELGKLADELKKGIGFKPDYVFQTLHKSANRLRELERIVSEIKELTENGICQPNVGECQWCGRKP